jgi:excisionase family DNA binding protein
MPCSHARAPGLTCAYGLLENMEAGEEHVENGVEHPRGSERASVKGLVRRINQGYKSSVTPRARVSSQTRSSQLETVEAVEVEPSELDRLDEVVTALGAQSQLGSVLRMMAHSVRSGSDVLVAGKDEHLTPSAAARTLGMSRTHLYKIMDAGDLPFVRVGRDRRIAAADLIKFTHSREKDRMRLAERFAHKSANRDALVTALAADE